MRNKKPIITAALIAPMLALTGGYAYASTTTSGSHPAPVRPAATSTAAPHSQHAASQVRHDRCDQRRGDRCDWRGTGYQKQAAQRSHHRHQAGQHRSHQNTGYQHRSGYRYGGSQGTWGYQGSGQYGSGYRHGNGGGNCGDCGSSWR